MTVTIGSKTVADVGDRTAVAPGIAIVKGSRSRPARSITLSELTAAEYAGQLTVLRETSRDVDVAARYGGEELSLILPHTGLHGTYVIAERTRETIEQMRVPLLDSDGTLQITASVGVAASADGDKNELISAADNALYVAKREGKNRTVKAGSQTANVFGGR